MGSNSAQCVLRNCHDSKILHLVRHGEGMHNVEVEKDTNALYSDTLFDAQLSPLGCYQVGKLRSFVLTSGLREKVELVVVSPMRRTLQTAVGVFGEESGDVEDQPPTNYPPVVANELCRERTGLYPCDKRNSVSHYRSLFPAIDFSEIISEDDCLWSEEGREDLDEVIARGLQFIIWLWTRQEKEIAVVSHGIFLQQTLQALFQNEACPRFANCELRQVTIDKSLIEKVFNTANERVNVPRGINLSHESSEEIICNVQHIDIKDGVCVL